MITPDEIIIKLERLYATVLQAWLRDESLFPLPLPVGQIPRRDFLQLRQSLETLKAGAKAQLGYGYSIEWENMNVRGAGPQSLPVRITVETETDYFRLLRKKREFDDFTADVALIRARLPQLNDWLEANPMQVIKYQGQWDRLLVICEYFKEYPQPDLYIRELPVPVHTKFIEDHVGILRQLLDVLLPAEALNAAESDFARHYGLRYDEPLVRFRILDVELLAKHHLPFSDISVPLSAFNTFDFSPHPCIIVENKLNFLTLPTIPNTFGIFGSGFKVDLLSSVRWLVNCPIIYWGDLDAQGFQILSMLRCPFPHVVSLMMDEQTLAAFSERVREGKESRVMDLPSLTLPERTLYERLAVNNLRLEQEQIDYNYACQQLSRLYG